MTRAYHVLACATMTPLGDEGDPAAVPRDLQSAVELYLATFGTGALPGDEVELLERADGLGPHVQNLFANVIHRHGWARFVDAVRAAGGGAS
jgi:hypothetical protein